MSSEFLFEIGCEEIPAAALESARAGLQELLQEELSARGLLAGEGVRTFATPRRLVATCGALAPAEADRVTEVVGPPHSVAYDAEGRPTRAAESFAAKQGIPVRELKLVDTPKGTYVAAVKRQPGAPTGQVLAAILPDIIARLPFPRTMYWTSPQGARFIRPIRWLLALWKGKPVELTLDGLRSGAVTYGHRLLAPRAFPVRGFADYQKRLRKAFVLVDADERRAKIVNECDRLVARLGLRRRADNELLESLVNLAEHPSALLGEFARDYLALPAEVLVTVMRHHQKYFSVEDAAGQLAPHFLAVIDLDADRSGAIRRGHEAVLAARFRDAQFFWQADQKRSLEDRVPELEQAVFVAQVGNYRQKVERVMRAARLLGETVSAAGRRADIAALERAARLAKADLSTEMVGEFPELQGIVGGLYARAQGEPEAVVRAIYDQYRPVGPEDAVPATLEGALVALADKLDTIAACFSVGLVPSGSRDPYALRRAAAGSVRLIVERRLRLSLRQGVEAVVEAGRDAGLDLADPAALADAILVFLEERARYYFREGRGSPYDEVNAAFAAGWDDLVDVGARLEALRAIRPTPDFEPLAAAFKRIRNILEQARELGEPVGSAVEESSIEAGAESELFARFQELGPRVADLRSQQRYPDAFREVASLRPQVDRFFDNVLVMTPEPDRRRNRLALLGQLLREFSTLADFSEIVVTNKPKES